MKYSDAERLKDPAALGALAREALGEAGHDAGHQHGGGDHDLVSLRQADHAGHAIVIRTTYEITVDGQPLATHLHLTGDGDLHSHALPNYQFHSAVDMVKKIIDLFPEEFAGGGDSGGGQHGHDHSGHDHSGDDQPGHDPSGHSHSGQNDSGQNDSGQGHSGDDHGGHTHQHR